MSLTSSAAAVGLSHDILMPLPRDGFDPTEAAVPWKKLKAHGAKIIIATPDGMPARADERMLTGYGLPSLWRSSLMAAPSAIALYCSFEASQEFLNPIAYDNIDPSQFDAILLPGGHAEGMRVYLESEKLQSVVTAFMESARPVAAICHGVVLLARSRISASPTQSVLRGRKVTALTRRQEWFAWALTRTTLGDYYRTYAMFVEDEVRAALQSDQGFQAGPGWPIPLRRDDAEHPEIGFAVRDGHILTARWPGDAHQFAKEFVSLLQDAPPKREI